MAWCERKGIGYIFGLGGNPVLRRQIGPLAEEAALGRLDGEGEKVRRYGDFRYAAKSWTVERRIIARIEAGPGGTDTRFVVTNLEGGRAQHLPGTSMSGSIARGGRRRSGRHNASFYSDPREPEGLILAKALVKLGAAADDFADACRDGLGVERGDGDLPGR
jgi:hypothetical protein